MADSFLSQPVFHPTSFALTGRDRPTEGSIVFFGALAPAWCDALRAFAWTLYATGENHAFLALERHCGDGRKRLSRVRAEWHQKDHNCECDALHRNLRVSLVFKAGSIIPITIH